jgi:hypothetical protein
MNTRLKVRDWHCLLLFLRDNGRDCAPAGQRDWYSSFVLFDRHAYMVRRRRPPCPMDAETRAKPAGMRTKRAALAALQVQIAM